MKRFVSCLALLASLSGAQGCAYFQENPPLEARPIAEFVASDLPIPDGFRMDTRASWRHERSNFRSFKLLYRRAEYLSEARVREFFRERYPEAGWELVFLYGVEETQLVFKKDAEECLVRIKEDFGARFTELSLEVQPRQTPAGSFVARVHRSSAATPR